MLLRKYSKVRLVKKYRLCERQIYICHHWRLSCVFIKWENYRPLKIFRPSNY